MPGTHRSLASGWCDHGRSGAATAPSANSAPRSCGTEYEDASGACKLSCAGARVGSLCASAGATVTRQAMRLRVRGVTCPSLGASICISVIERDDAATGNGVRQKPISNIMAHPTKHTAPPLYPIKKSSLTVFRARNETARKYFRANNPNGGAFEPPHCVGRVSEVAGCWNPNQLARKLELCYPDASSDLLRRNIRISRRSRPDRRSADFKVRESGCYDKYGRRLVDF